LTHITHTMYNNKRDIYTTYKDRAVVKVFNKQLGVDCGRHKDKA